jgi:hypothetical protein
MQVVKHSVLLSLILFLNEEFKEKSQLWKEFEETKLAEINKKNTQDLVCSFESRPSQTMIAFEFTNKIQKQFM